MTERSCCPLISIQLVVSRTAEGGEVVGSQLNTVWVDIFINSLSVVL